MKKILYLITLIVSTNSWSAYTKISSSPNRLELMETVVSMNDEQIDEIAKKRKNIIKEVKEADLNLCKTWEDIICADKKLAHAHRELERFEYGVSYFLELLKDSNSFKYEEKLNYEEFKLAKEGFAFLTDQFHYTTPAKYEFFKNLIKPELRANFNQNNVKEIIQNNTKKSVRPSTIIEHFFEKSFYEKLEIGAKKINALLQNEDTLVVVGNTPQYLREALEWEIKKETISKTIKIISIALSGWPGVFKEGFIQNIITTQGLENYRNYMERLGLSAKSITSKRLFFLDRVHKGRGIEFLIEEFIRTFSDPKQVPDINIISVGPLDLDDDAGKGNKFKGEIFEVDNINLDMEDLAETLDVEGPSGNSLRYTPSFPAWRWHEWSEPVMPCGELAEKVLLNIKNHFNSIPISPYIA